MTWFEQTEKKLLLSVRKKKPIDRAMLVLYVSACAASKRPISRRFILRLIASELSSTEFVPKKEKKEIQRIAMKWDKEAVVSMLKTLIAAGAPVDDTTFSALATYIEIKGYGKQAISDIWYGIDSKEREAVIWRRKNEALDFAGRELMIEVELEKHIKR
jgi:hypothetical protein